LESLFITIFVILFGVFFGVFFGVVVVFFGILFDITWAIEAIRVFTEPGIRVEAVFAGTALQTRNDPVHADVELLAVGRVRPTGMKDKLTESVELLFFGAFETILQYLFSADASLAVGVFGQGAGAGDAVEDHVNGARDVAGLSAGAQNHHVADAFIGVLEDTVSAETVANRLRRL